MGIADGNVSPKDIQDQYNRGRKRFQNFRNARTMFLRNYVGPYYDSTHGRVGDEAINLIYNAIRNLVPNIAMNFPKYNLRTDILPARQYGELLALALQFHDKQNNMKNKIRAFIVDSIFTLGIFKTGLAESDDIQTFDDDTFIDTGTIYTELVDFDSFAVDPDSTQHLFSDAKWMGDIIRIPRINLLESGLYNNDLIERLPSVDEITSTKDGKRARDLSQQALTTPNRDFMDEVEIAELWVPGANALLTVPATDDISFDQFLRVDDYYGPDSGPYTLLSLSPPVPGNPLPVPMVGVWNDLHKLANEAAAKINEQALAQKDVIVYKPSAADDVESFRDAANLDAIAVDDMGSITVESVGGQKPSNELYLNSLNNWFNTLASNPQALAGEPQQGVGSATEARILQGNANIGLEDAKDLVYDAVAQEAGKRAWYMHTDPLIQIPLVRRIQVPAQFGDGAFGPQMISPSSEQEIQVLLTPEARREDWFKFTFTVQAESMGREDQQTRFAKALEFAVQIVPAAFQAAQMAFAMGMPFNVNVYLERLAKERGIEWLNEVFFDPTFQARWQQITLAGPQVQGSQGQAGPSQPKSGLQSNGQPGQVQKVPGQVEQFNQQSQIGANQSQSQLRGEGFG